MNNEVKNSKKIKILVIVSALLIVAIIGVIILINSLSSKDPCEDGHTIEEFIISPTCIDDGYTFHKCKNCDYSYNDNFITKEIHDFSYEIIESSTCTKEGTAKAICNLCGFTKNETINVLPHTIGQIEYTDEKCGNHNTGYSKCIECNEKVLEFGHHYNKTVIQATCENNGQIIYKCEICGDEYFEVIPAHGHIESDFILVNDSSCATYGLKETRCQKCNKVVQSIITDKRDHNFAISVSNDTVNYSCTDCQYNFEEQIQGDYFVIHFDSNGGSSINDYYIFEDMYFSLPTPVKEEYIFGGWYYDVDCQMIATPEDICDDVTLYAKWDVRSLIHYNANLTMEQQDLGFVVYVQSDQILTDANLSNYIKVVNSNNNNIECYIDNVNDNIYSIKLNDYQYGEMYTLTTNNGVKIQNSNNNKIIIFTKKENQLNYKLQSGVVSISINNVVGAYEIDNEQFILLQQNLLNINDNVVIYDDETNNIVSFFKISHKQMSNNYYVYKVVEVSEDVIFAEYNGYYYGDLNINDIEFYSNFEEELVRKFKKSPLYDQFKYAVDNVSLDNNDYHYMWSDIKITPTKATSDNNIIVKLKISSDCIKVNNKDGSKKTEFTVVLEISNTFNFAIQQSFESITDFFFTLDVNGKSNINLYVSSEKNLENDIEFHYFKEQFFKAKEKGTNDELQDMSGSTYEQEQKIGSIGTFIYGFYIGLDVKLHFDFNMVGEAGVNIDIYSNLKAGLNVNGIDKISLIKDFESTTHTSIYAMGKIESSASVKVDATISFLGIAHITATLEAGPYLEMGGYFAINDIFTDNQNTVFAGYMEIGVNVKASISVGLALKISVNFAFFKSSIGVEKSWSYTLYDDTIEIFNIGKRELPLYFEQIENEKYFEFDCKGEINLNNIISNKIVIQHIDKNTKQTISTVCKYLLNQNLEGVTISEDGIMKIENVHTDHLIINLKVFDKDCLIFKVIVLNIRLFHNAQLVEAKSPDCYEEGNSEYTICTICGDVINGERIIYPKYHPETIELISENALRAQRTCYTRESYWKTCLVCHNLSDSEYFEVGIFDDHKFNSEYDCVDKECIVCGYVLAATKQHDYSNSYCNCGTKLYSDGLKYELNLFGDEYAVIGYESYIESNIVIPAFYNGLPVTRIGSNAFTNCSPTSIYISEGIEVIEEQAFSNCSSLRNISFPSSLKEIGVNIFESNMVNLNYTIYENGKYLGNEKNPYLVYFSCIDHNVDSFVIHDDTTIIWSLAFSNCDSLVEFKIPQQIQVIGNKAFYHCNKLENLEIGENVLFVGNQVCASCYNVTVYVDINCPETRWDDSWFILDIINKIDYRYAEVTYD